MSTLKQLGESEKPNAENGKENDYFVDVLKEGDEAEKLEMQFINEVR